MSDPRWRVAEYNENPICLRVAHIDFYLSPQGEYILVPFTKGEVHFANLLVDELHRLSSDNARYLARIEELTQLNNIFYALYNKMMVAINYLYDQCDNLPHAADCDPDKTGYCTCARMDFNSLVVNYHAEFSTFAERDGYGE